MILQFLWFELWGGGGSLAAHTWWHPSAATAHGSSNNKCKKILQIFYLEILIFENKMLKKYPRNMMKCPPQKNLIFKTNCLFFRFLEHSVPVFNKILKDRSSSGAEIFYVNPACPEPQLKEFRVKVWEKKSCDHANLSKGALLTTDKLYIFFSFLIENRFHSEKNVLPVWHCHSLFFCFLLISWSNPFSISSVKILVLIGSSEKVIRNKFPESTNKVVITYLLKQNMQS